MDDRNELRLREWERFTKGSRTCSSLVAPGVYRSWERCSQLCVDPFSKSGLDSAFLSKAEVSGYIVANTDSRSCRALQAIRDVADGLNLILTVYDKNGCLTGIVNHSYPAAMSVSLGVESLFLRDLSEGRVGTNAVSVALFEKKPVQVIGSEHYHTWFHRFSCTAAPLHDVAGGVIGAVGASSVDTSQNASTLALVISIAEIFDCWHAISRQKKQIGILEGGLEEIIDCLPDGALILDDEENIVKCNKSMLYGLKAKAHNLKAFVEDVRRMKDSGVTACSRSNGSSHYHGVGEYRIRDIVDDNQHAVGRNLRIASDSQGRGRHAGIVGNRAMYEFDDIVGYCDEMISLKDIARKAARFPSAILIRGESGTGKEIFAQAIHNASHKSNGPFVAINCGAIPDELVESELFGYESGAFTGALRNGKVGKIESASGGTLFLDEIESMPLNAQVALLRCLSDRAVTRIGGLGEIPVDIRVISATKADLLERMAEGRFREDLYYRISALTLVIPPLRSRGIDVKYLADHYISRFSDTFGMDKPDTDERFYESLLSYQWPGNVRELMNVVERALLLSNGGSLTSGELPPNFESGHSLERQLVDSISGDRNGDLLKFGETAIIRRILREENGNITRCAKRLGISRPTLYRRIRSLPGLYRPLRD